MIGMLRIGCLAVLATAAVSLSVMAQEPPPAGVSPRIDAIRKAGVLRIGVLANLPWLAENTKSDGGEPWSGPAWILSKEYARLLGVKLEPVLVSHETKVPVLASNQVDMTISPLAETPERLAAIDFVIYSATSVCMFGRADNAKFAKAKTVDELNNPDITIAYFVGGGEAAQRRQLPGQHGEGGTGRHRHRQEPAGLSRLAAHRGQGLEGEARCRRAQDRRYAVSRIPR